MKEVLGGAANFMARHAEEGKGFIPSVEVIVLTTEPQYAVDAAGQLVKSRTVDQVRFVISPAGLRKLAKDFAEWADEAEQLVAESVAAQAIKAQVPPAAEGRAS